MAVTAVAVTVAVARRQLLAVSRSVRELAVAGDSSLFLQPLSTAIVPRKRRVFFIAEKRVLCEPAKVAQC